MRKTLLLLLALVCFCLGACGEETAPVESPAPPMVTVLPLPGPEIISSPEPAPAQTIAPTPVPTAEPQDGYLVNMREIIPSIEVELRYAGENNFTGKKIYNFEEPYLRYGTLKKLLAVQEELASMGLGLKIWDAFRPVSAQFALWEICPNPVYVANPNTGFSSHSRGNTLDLTLVDAEAKELTMPTGFDDFSLLADRNYSDCPPEAAENALLLQSVMEKHGFSGYYGEWWHYTDTQSYDVEKVFDPALISQRRARCEEFISLRSAPNTSADTLTRIPAGERFTLLGYSGDFSYVDYLGLRGYVLTAYTME